MADDFAKSTLLSLEQQIVKRGKTGHCSFGKFPTFPVICRAEVCPTFATAWVYDGIAVALSDWDGGSELRFKAFRHMRAAGGQQLANHQTNSEPGMARLMQESATPFDSVQAQVFISGTVIDESKT